MKHTLCAAALLALSLTAASALAQEKAPDFQACIDRTADAPGPVVQAFHACYDESTGYWDKQLNERYQKARAGCDAAPKPDECRSKLKHAERLWMQYRDGAFKKVEAVTSATVKVHEFTALAALKEPIAEKANVAGVEMSRLALGGDLIAGHSHARDLIWTDEFMRRYNSGVTLPRTVRYCLHCGIDTAFVEPEFIAPMSAAAKEVGGSMKFFANCADEKDAALAKSVGARAVYLRPEVADALAARKDADGAKSLFAALKATGLPAGVGAEDVATVKFCAESGVTPDFWVLAFHSLDYPAATMETRCNNIWCVDPKAAADHMKTRSEPWVAIRCLAGGAIDPVKAYRFATTNGATAASIDLLDYRIVDTVNGIMKKPDKGAAKKKEAAK